MNVVEICLPFIVAILGLAYPIILQIISRLDEKYGSDISALFKKEKEYKFFKFILKTSLFFIAFYVILMFLQLVLDKSYSIFVLFEIKIIIFLSTIAVIISFFLLISKMLKYYSTKEIVLYLIEKQKSTPSENEYLEAIKSIFLFSIRQQDDKIARTINDFITTLFQTFNESNPDISEGYPDDYYQLVYDVAQQSLVLERNKLFYIELNAISGSWLLLGYSDNKISNRTYSHLWHLLLLAVSFKRDDLVIAFWKNSDQFLDYSLSLPERQLSSDYKLVLNKVEIETREKERERFLQFHYALCGLLMYQKRFDCIRRFFRYTSSEPPSYSLLPSFLSEIYSRYIFYRDWFERNIPFIQGVYPFPDIEGVRAGGVIRNWICKYIAVLFLRQYTLLQYYTYQKFLEIPNSPPSQSEQKFWLENIDYFKTLVSDILENKSLLNELGFDLYDNFSDTWCIQQKKPKPLELIDQIKEMISNSIVSLETEQSPEPSKVLKFEEATKQNVQLVFKEYLPIKNPNPLPKNLRSWKSLGIMNFFNKAAFCDSQDTDYGNYYSILSQQFASNFRRSVSEIFFFAKSKSYLLKQTDLIKGIDNLKLNSEAHIIISFGLNEYRLKQVGDFSDGLLNGIKFINFPICNYELIGGSFFILKQSDLPFINYNKISKEDIDKYKLKPLVTELNLYSSVLDLNVENEVRESLKNVPEGIDLRKQVLVYIGISVEISWKKDIKLIQISLASPYEQQGLPNNPDEIIPFSEKDK